MIAGEQRSRREGVLRRRANNRAREQGRMGAWEKDNKQRFRLTPFN
jgi:hypothetical protein